MCNSPGWTPRHNHPTLHRDPRDRRRGAPRVAAGEGSSPLPRFLLARVPGGGDSPRVLRSSRQAGTAPRRSFPPPCPLPAQGSSPRQTLTGNTQRPRLDETYMPKKATFPTRFFFFDFFFCVCLFLAAAEDSAPALRLAPAGARSRSRLLSPPLPPAATAVSPQTAPARRRPQRMAQEEQHCSSPLGCEA